MDEGGIYTYMTIIGMVSISDDGNGNIDGLYLPNNNLPALQDRESDILTEAAKQLEDFLLGKIKDFDLPLSINGTVFQMKVWDAIQKIPYGETMTYAQIANIIGHEGAYRAVGTACRCNPIPIIIPCHRVMNSAGNYKGYNGGSTLKKRLLDLEQKH